MRTFPAVRNRSTFFSLARRSISPALVLNQAIRSHYPLSLGLYFLVIQEVAITKYSQLLFDCLSNSPLIYVRITAFADAHEARKRVAIIYFTTGPRIVTYRSATAFVTGLSDSTNSGAVI
jgi:hypothetical protein